MVLSPPEVAEKIGKALHVPLADITGVIEFYSMLYAEPVGKSVIRVCTSPTCSAQGAHQLVEETAAQLSTAPDGEFTLRARAVSRAVRPGPLCIGKPSAGRPC